MTTEEIKSKVLALLTKMNLEKPAAGDAALTLDSLSMMMFVYEVETLFKVKFGIDDMNGELTLGRLIGLLAAKLNP